MEKNLNVKYTKKYTIKSIKNGNGNMYLKQLNWIWMYIYREIQLNPLWIGVTFSYDNEKLIRENMNRYSPGFNWSAPISNTIKIVYEKMVSYCHW